MRNFPSRYFRALPRDDESFDPEDMLDGLMTILSVDEENHRVLVKEFYAWEGDEDWLEEKEFDDLSPVFVPESLVDEEWRRREERRKEAQRKWAREREEQRRLEEKEKNARFASSRAKYPRNARIALKKGYDRSVLDFARKEDSLYLDDVTESEGCVAYFLRVVGERKNRGVYVFRTDRPIGEEFIELSPQENDAFDLDYGYYSDGIYGIGKRKD